MTALNVDLLQCLINGYCVTRELPVDIINIIKLYLSYSLDINTFLLCHRNLSLHSVIEPDKQYTMDIHHYSSNQNKTIHWTSQKQAPTNFKLDTSHITNQTFLPPILQPFFKNENYQNICSSNKWSLMFQIQKYHSFQQQDKAWNHIQSLNGSSCYLTAIHPYFMSNGSCKAFNFILPSFPFDYKHPEDDVSFIYSRINKTLYAADHHNIYTLNLKTQMNMDWQTVANGLIYKNMTNRSLCMVDQDRFIAVIGGIEQTYRSKRSNYAELYALNCGLSIKLKDMNCPRRDALSVYNQVYHEIIVCNSTGVACLERYDINKDEWIKMYNHGGEEILDVNEIIIDETNPKIIKAFTFHYHNFQLCTIDRRSKNSVAFEFSNPLYFSGDISIVRF